MPSGFTTQESAIGQTVTAAGDPTQYGGAKIQKSPGVRVLADFRGLSLYTFDGETCADECRDQWQPLAAPLMAVPRGDWSIVRRADGSPQWAYKGRPLYTFVNDAKAGDTHGDCLNGTWHAARP